MIKIILFASFILFLITTLSACSLSGYTLRHDVQQVLKDNFNSEIQLIEARTERKDGTPIATGRQLIWLFDHKLNHYLFFQFIASEYTERRELKPDVLHSRHSRPEIRDMIASQREDLRIRVTLLQNRHRALTSHIEQPFFVHFGHTDRYRYTQATDARFSDHHPLYLNIAMPTEFEDFLFELENLLPALESHLKTHPNGKVSFYPTDANEVLAPLFATGYWVSDGPPKPGFIGSRPFESQWHDNMLVAQRAVLPEPASRQEERYRQVTMNADRKRLHAYETAVNTLASSNGMALDIQRSGMLLEKLNQRFEAALEADAKDISSKPVQTLHFLDRKNNEWVLHFFATERSLKNPLHVRFNLTTQKIKVSSI